MVNIALHHYNLSCFTHNDTDFKVDIIWFGNTIQDNSVIINKTDGGLEVIQARSENIFKRIINFINPFNQKRVIVYIPKNYIENIEVKMISGNLRMENITAENCTLEVKSGNIKLINCSGDTDIKSKSGNVKVSTHHGNVNAAGVSGNVYVETDSITKNSVISTKSGNIKTFVYELNTDLTIQGKSGNIKLVINRLNGNVTARTVSGNVKALFREDAKAIFNTQSTGNKNDFESSKLPNSEIPFVNLHTKSGIVRVKKSNFI
ncbi:MAG: DUF4097 domain-containing protein [Oscillospiraceae bacterium]|nr:DUF4097 domain-containing protein [Oscillospiraceae bacterium]